jgi:cation diffusion facilitator family transporter
VAKETKQDIIDRIVLTSFLVDLSDVIISLVGTILTKSVTMLSQTLEGFSDLFSSGFIFVGNRRAKLPPDKKHPYGYGKEIHFWSLMSGIVTFSITATFSIYLGYKRFVEPEVIENFFVAIFALVFSLFSNGYSTILSFKRLMHKKKPRQYYKTFLNSPLIEVKTTFILDLMGTCAAILGLIALLIYYFTGDLRFDGVGSMIIGITLGVLSIFILTGAKELIVGKSAPKETRDRIEIAVLSFDAVKTIQNLRTLVLGSKTILITLEINVSDELTTDQLEALIDRIETKIRENISWKALIDIELEN